MRRGLADASRLSERRRTVASELFYGPGGATARATACIYDVLGLPAPELLASEATPAFAALKRGTA